ncbi:hypothetical protein MJ572_05590 [Escherichia coli]|nr:hypothetical protein MJ572_05590 [Escherichia coli]
MTVFDSQGNAHDAGVYFVKTGDNNWQVYTRIVVIQTALRRQRQHWCLMPMAF